MLVEVAKWALLQMRDPADAPEDPHEVARRYTAPEFADVRRLLLELHLATYRHERVARLLGEWHVAQAERAAETRGSVAAEKMYYVILMGLAQLDALSALQVDDTEFHDLLDAAIDGIFPDA